jgi:hypothetical protein
MASTTDRTARRERRDVPPMIYRANRSAWVADHEREKYAGKPFFRRPADALDDRDVIDRYSR